MILQGIEHHWSLRGFISDEIGYYDLRKTPMARVGITKNLETLKSITLFELCPDSIFYVINHPTSFHLVKYSTLHVVLEVVLTRTIR